MVLEGHTTDYAMEEDAIQVSLPSVSVCMIAKWTYSEAQPSPEKCVFSYAIPERPNELLICLRPTVRVFLHIDRRFGQLCANLPCRNRIVSQ